MPYFPLYMIGWTPGFWNATFRVWLFCCFLRFLYHVTLNLSPNYQNIGSFFSSLYLFLSIIWSILRNLANFPDHSYEFANPIDKSIKIKRFPILWILGFLGLFLQPNLGFSLNLTFFLEYADIGLLLKQRSLAIMILGFVVILIWMIQIRLITMIKSEICYWFFIINFHPQAYNLTSFSCYSFCLESENRRDGFWFPIIHLFFLFVVL